MKGNQIVAIVASLLLGAGAAWLYLHLHSNWRLLGADDSPVTVAGGSLEAISSVDWSQGSQCPNGGYSYWTTANDTSLSISGVQQVSNGTVSKFVETVSDSNIKQSWAITLEMRDANDASTQDYEVVLSDSDPCASPTTTFPTNKVFLADFGKKALGPPDFQQNETTDGYHRIQFDVPACTGNWKDNAHSRCNHPSTITSQGLSFTDNSGLVQATQFNCRAGICAIGIGTTTQ